MKIRIQERSLLLFVFGVFIVLGNLPRIIPIPHFPSHFSITELALYFLTMGSIWRYRNEMGQLWMVPVLIALSTGYGVLLHGFELPCVLYGFKLIAMLSAGWCIGKALFARFGEEIPKMASWLMRLFTINMLIGFLIFFTFPNASQFFNFLGNYGLVFTGDPHSFRFISPYFDPNYYSAIACIPLLLLRHMEKRPFILRLLLWGSVLLSFSRSGIATCLIVASIPVLQMLMKHWVVRAGSFFVLIGAVGLTCFFSEAALHFLKRLVWFFEDSSAQCRWISFQQGWDHFMQYPFFGMGFNFLTKPYQDQGTVLTIDSSLLQTLADFGFIFSLGLLVAGVVWSLNRISMYKGTKFEPIFKEFYFYVLIVAVFSSLFNNILYYQFWLIPIVAIFSYLERAFKNSNNLLKCQRI